MNVKYNEFGEVISVNGLTTGQHLGAPMQDAIAEKPEDNEAYGTQFNTVTRVENTVDDKQPSSSAKGGSEAAVRLVYDASNKKMYLDGKQPTKDEWVELAKKQVPLEIIYMSDLSENATRMGVGCGFWHIQFGDPISEGSADNLSIVHLDFSRTGFTTYTLLRSEPAGSDAVFSEIRGAWGV